ncbi:DUF2079 domain-containing protein [Oculatella sp. LEGE 06141]|uniref:DUF2079 domain-containing protein n=1 Tax=Oculatella sp. LEGE 06141 TaxID=1828648 RepID=UPI00187E946D|nr:DUF2079 domain-containing protein [Oculatella sp. LEGE 06141]MBE9181749.1 DUF2079 domain-containing protein [Oculatella sp. LEGE 06141]
MWIWKKEPELRIVIGVAAVFWLLVNLFVLLRYYNFYPSYAAFNQGIFDQLFWNGLHGGQFFQSSLSSALSSAVVNDGEPPTVNYYRLGQHFTPALLLWVPFYALYSSPAGLSVLQTTLIAAAGLVLYALARHYHPPRLSLWIAASYYGAIAIISPTLADFRDFSQLPLFVFGALLAFEKRQWWLFWILFGLTLLIREDAGVVLFGIGIYFIFSRRAQRVGLGVCALSLTYMLVVTNLVMPLFSDDIARRFMIEQFGQFVDRNEASTLDIIGGILSRPWQFLLQLVTPLDGKVRYLLAQWLPLAFIPALSPSAWTMTSFPLLQTFLRQDPDALSINLRYALTWIPGLFYGAILWWDQHPKQLRSRFRQFWLACLTLSLILTIAANPNRSLSALIPDSFQPWVYVSPSRQWQHAQAIRSLMAQIPPDASVSATVYIQPHLSNRRELLIFPQLRLENDAGQVVQMQYVIADLWQLEQYQVAFDDDRRRLRSFVPAIERLLNRRYGLMEMQDGVLLLRRGADSNPEAAAAWSTYRQDLKVAIERSPNE